MKRIMDLLPTDVGRPVQNLALHLDYATLAEDAAEVVRTLRLASREVRGDRGAWFQVRLVPYRTRKNVIAGVVVTFVDVTPLKRSEQVAKTAQVLAEGVVATIRDPLLVLDEQLRVEAANAAFYRTFRVSREETAGQRFYELGDGQWDIPRLRQLLEEVVPRKGEVERFPVDRDFPHIGPRRLTVSARRVEVEGVPPKVVLAIHAGAASGDPAGEPEREPAG
jgi:PAS domain-containing protein